MAYKPSLPFSVPMRLLIPTYTNVDGVRKKTFPTIENGIRINGTFRTFGGTEREINGVYGVEDTGNVETWYRPDITSGCRIAIETTGAIYDILGEPENIEMRNQICVFKVTRYKGSA